MPTRSAKPSPLLVAARSSPGLETILRQFQAVQLEVVFAATTDAAVALLMGNPFSAVVLDAALIRNDDWTVAKSLKLIKPNIPIVLLDARRLGDRKALPANIDVLISSDDPNEILVKIRQLIC